MLRLRRDLEVGRLEVGEVGHDQVGAEGREPLLQRGRPLAEEAVDLYIDVCVGVGRLVD